jgi:hypothetical protein
VTDRVVKKQAGLSDLHAKYRLSSSQMFLSGQLGGAGKLWGGT